MQEQDRGGRIARLWFDKMALRRLSFMDREEPSLAESATDLEGIVRSSRAFSWMGIATQREASGEVSYVALHFLRDPNTILPDETQANIEVLAEELGLALDPIPSRYFLTHRPEYTPSGFKEELLTRYASVEGNWVLERDEFLEDTNIGNHLLADFFSTMQSTNKPL